MLGRDRGRLTPGTAASRLRWIGLAAAVAVGVALGWDSLPLSQTLRPEGGGRAPAATPVPGTPTAAVPVQSSGTSPQRMGTQVRVGAPAPDFALVDLEGGTVSLGGLRGRVILLNFWTTWCPPCRSEMPALQDVYDRRAEDGFVVLGVNWTALDDPDEVEPFVEELELTFPILLDTEGRVSGELYHLLALPTSVFVGRDGTVREIRIGALDLEYLDERIAALLEESP